MATRSLAPASSAPRRTTPGMARNMSSATMITGTSRSSPESEASSSLASTGFSAGTSLAGSAALVCPASLVMAEMRATRVSKGSKPRVNEAALNGLERPNAHTQRSQAKMSPKMASGGTTATTHHR